MNDTYSQISYAKLYIWKPKGHRETEVVVIVSAEGYGCNGVDPLPIGESGGPACRIPSF